ncbi:MAG: hypothetical protein QOF60_181 [Actinomycetota bacterium]|jgi:hypothetical protein|nr:hypothetical protein [Actinomycetota bacterium]
MDPLVARKTWRTLEPLHGLIYFAPEASDAYVALGLQPGQGGYFASRAAAMGAVPAEVVIATFFNFYPPFVRRTIPSAWSIASPAAILSARLSAAGSSLRRALGDLASTVEVEEAAVLARRAAEAACQWPEGRPLFAAHAALPWPEDDPLLVLWHAQTLLREFRGDGHIAAMTVEGVTGVEALIIHGATGDVPSSTLQSSRSWPDDEWAAGVEGLRARGWLDVDGGLTSAGREHRQWVEDRTDALAVAAYEAIGEDGCDRLRMLCRPLSKTIVSGGAFGFR